MMRSFAFCLTTVLVIPLIEPNPFAPKVVDLETRMEQLDQQSSSTTPYIPVITGPFYVEIEVQFYDLSKTWQRMFDFATDSSSHHIFLTKHGSSPGNVAVQYTDDSGNGHWLSVDNVITTGAADLWRVGVGSDGLLSLHMNGILLESEKGVVPPTGAVLRDQQNLGMSAPSGSNSLDGVISNLKVQNLSDPEVPLFRSLANLPSQVLRESFIASVYVRFDETSGRPDQPVFDFRGASGNHVIRFRQSGSGTAVALDLIQDGLQTTCTTLTGAIIEEEMALWKIQMDGTSWKIQKEGSGSAVTHTCTGMATPVSTLRTVMRIGESPGLPIFEGVVLGLRLDTDSSSRR